MRLANPEILQRALDSRNPGKRHWDNQQAEIDARETPAIKLDPSSLDLSVPEMEPGPFVPGQDLMRDKHIRQNYGSGVAVNPLLPVGQFIRQAAEGMPTHPGTMYPGPDPFQPHQVRPADSDDQYMDVMRSGFV